MSLDSPLLCAFSAGLALLHLVVKIASKTKQTRTSLDLGKNFTSYYQHISVTNAP